VIRSASAENSALECTIPFVLLGLGWFRFRPFQGLDILWTVDSERRSVLAHGHHSLCLGLFSFGLSALSVSQ
jgi:hypothetical protein